jgi:catechol 2,3-dioxygenase-like lactoylglutathione lyase family enzyme
MTPSHLPGLRGVDHIGFTVPDMNQAHDFLTRVIGCQLVYSLGPWSKDDDWFATHLHVDARSTIKEIRLYRCHQGSNFEVFEFEAPDQELTPPKNSDIGGHHVAFYVDDIDLAIAFLVAEGLEVFQGPTSSSGASLGQRWIYFLSPWGMQFELVSFPQGKAYEAEAEVRLWNPRFPNE